MAWLQQQQHLILRLPEPLAKLSKKLLNSDKKKTSPMVEVKPEDATTMSNDFIFTMNGKEYPALLMNLPTIVETHKTFDNKIFLKSGDIGQVLQVFETQQERDAMREKTCKTPNGDYMPSGITPPTADIVKRRFEPTRKTDSYLPYRIRSLIKEIGEFGSRPGRLVNPKTGEEVDGDDPQSASAVEVVDETVTEEVVDFEEWMVDPVTQSRRTGVTLTLHGSQLGTLKDFQSDQNVANLSPSMYQTLLLLQHPEILVTEEEVEEDQIDTLAAEQAREQKRAISAGSSSTPGTAMVVSDSEDANPANNASSSSSTSAAPLKLSLSMRRPAASTTAAAQSQEDVALLQDEEGDNANSEQVEGENGLEEGSEHESDIGDNQADAFEVDDDEDSQGEHSENKNDNGSDSGSDDDIAAMLLARRAAENASVAAPGGSEIYENSATDSFEPENAESMDQDEQGSQNGDGNGGNEIIDRGADDEDKDSVNSDDSDAWMREA